MHFDSRIEVLRYIIVLQFQLESEVDGREGIDSLDLEREQAS